MKVSIITVSFNSEATIKDTINSIRNQNYKDIEYIIIDGGSKDKTVEIVNQNLDVITKWISENDKGIYDAMNKGIEMASGEIIGILNSDDMYYDGQVVERIVKSFIENEVDCVYSNLFYVDPLNTSKVKRYWKSKEFDLKSFLYGWMPAHPTFFVKKNIYEKYGKFNTKLKSAADYELMLRFMYKFKISARYQNFISVIMRSGGKSNESILSRLKANKEDRLAWEINGLKPYFFTTFLKPLRKINQFVNCGQIF